MKFNRKFLCYTLSTAVIALVSIPSAYADKVRVDEDGTNNCNATGSSVTCTSGTTSRTYTGCSAHRYGGWMCNSVMIAPDGTVTLRSVDERTVSE
ncbi:hypothetical protein [Marinicellulosiphila megalodicopiae]|uniref:hypothetical protein n=1 Tax=Marinicellulosiphila megalodicopiae TaxID=2724896 RepID=UPI003BB014E2